MCDAGSFAGVVRRSVLLIVAVLFPSVGSAALVGAGDIAFIRFNADGTDDLAIVLLADGDAGQQVHFNDNQYFPAFGQFTDFESRFTWTLTEALVAGTVVTFSNLDNGLSPGVASHGTISGAKSSVQTMPLSASGETVYAFLGTDNRRPTTFLAAVTTDTGDVLNGTGLTFGDSAVLLPTDIDEAHYTGARDSEAAFPDYRTLIGNIGGGWQVRTTDTGSLSAFDTTNFALAGTEVPESPRVALLCLCGMLGWIATRSRRPRQEAV